MTGQQAQRLVIRSLVWIALSVSTQMVEELQQEPIVEQMKTSQAHFIMRTPPRNDSKREPSLLLSVSGLERTNERLMTEEKTCEKRGVAIIVESNTELGAMTSGDDTELTAGTHIIEVSPTHPAPNYVASQDDEGPVVQNDGVTNAPVYTIEKVCTVIHTSSVFNMLHLFFQRFTHDHSFESSNGGATQSSSLTPSNMWQSEHKALNYHRPFRNNRTHTFSNSSTSPSLTSPHNPWQFSERDRKYLTYAFSNSSGSPSLTHPHNPCQFSERKVSNHQGKHRMHALNSGRTFQNRPSPKARRSKKRQRRNPSESRQRSSSAPDRNDSISPRNRPRQCKGLPTFHEYQLRTRRFTSIGDASESSFNNSNSVPRNACFTP